MMIDEKSNDGKVAAESYENTETLYTERKPRSRERGPDKKPRTYRANSMSNLTQFRQRPEEFTQYLKDEKGVDVTGNSGIAKTILVLVGLMIAVIGGLWLYDWYKNRQSSN